MPGAYLGCKATMLKCCLALAGCVEVQDTQPCAMAVGVAWAL